MKANKERVDICAICHQDADRPCRGRITGRPLTQWHGYPNAKAVQSVTKRYAEQIQKDLSKGFRDYADFDPTKRRHDGTQAGRG